jgi:hypothetical protein
MRRGRKFGSNYGCFNFVFEKKTVKFFVQCHAFAQSPPGRRLNDKYLRSRFVQKCFTEVLFGNSYTVATESDMFVCVRTHRNAGWAKRIQKRYSSECRVPRKSFR